MEQTIEAPIVGLWDDTKLFTRYKVALAFTGRVMGGIPQKPEIIESWLRQRILGGDEELRISLVKTLADLEIEVPADATREDIIEAAKKIAATRNGNTFRRDSRGLLLAAYQVKALLKEATNILFPYGEGYRFGQHKNAKGEEVGGKGAKSYLAERVFVDEESIPLGRIDPDGTHMQIGQVSGPKGPRSTLTYYDFCEKSSISFTVSSLRDCITLEQWRDILLAGQRLGLGALRSMGYGTFLVTAFDKV